MIKNLSFQKLKEKYKMSKIDNSIIFENSYTKLYEKVYEFQTPKDYIYYENIDGEDQYTPLYEIFNSNPKTPMIELYDKYGKILKFSYFINAYYYFNVEPGKESDAINFFEKVNEGIYEYNQRIKDETGKIINNFIPYTSVNELVKGLNPWYNDYQFSLKTDLEQRGKIINIKEKLIEYEPVKNEGLNIEKMTFEFNPNIDVDREDKFSKKTLDIKPEIGILVFNEMRCSDRVPYIQFNNQYGEKFYKIYDIDNVSDISKFIDQSMYIDNKESTFFIKVLDPDYGEFVKNEDWDGIKKSSYIDCRYNLSKNKLDFTTSQMNRTKVIGSLNESYKLFNIRTEKRKYNIQAKLTIKNFTFKPEVLHFMILNEYESQLDLHGLISTYFFMDETNKTMAEKELFEIKYKALSNDDEDETLTALLPSSLTAKISQEGDDINIRIIKAMNNKVLSQFLEIFSRFLNIYKEYEEGISEIFESYIPEEDEDFEDDFEDDKKKDKTEKKVKQLRESFAEIRGVNSKDKNLLFSPGTTGYTRICECKKQPIIVETVEDAEDWKSRKFVYKNENMERQIGAFPPVKGEELFSFVCPEDDYPFPSVAKNNDINSKKFPFVPCCAKTDEINNPKSNYNNYYANKTDTDKDNPNKSYKLNTMKSLEDNREGEIPKQIQNLLDCKDSDEDKFKYARLGFGRSKNTFIHCILRAIKDPNYMKILEDTKAKEKYCENFRRNIPNLLPNFFEVCKQENYNKNKEYILSEITNVRKNFKSEMYYRILEEIFNINIYVILHRESMSNKEIKNEDPAIETPNHILTHIRPFRSDRYTIIILKHMGGEMENLKTPLYDLVFNSGILVKNEKGLAVSEREFIFDNRINNILYQAYINNNKSLVFDIDDSIIEAREYPYSRVYWPEIFKDFKIESQTIDSNGKCRSFNLFYTSDKTRDIRLTVYIPPSQPIDVPENEEVYKSEYEIVRHIFGTPSKEIKDGLWYRTIDFEYGIFIPCDTDSVEIYPETPVPSTELSINNPIIKFRNSRKYAILLLDCIIWGLRSNGILNLEDYLDEYENYIYVDEAVRPNIHPVKIRSYLTEKGDFVDLSRIWPEYFTSKNKVKLYPELYDKVIRYLANYYKETDGLSLPPNPYLTDVFKYEWDFSHKDITNRILIGEDHLKQWIKLRDNTYKGELQIYRELSKEKLENEIDIPFLYEHQKKIFLIQHVKEGNFTRALNCGDVWNRKKFNKGYDSSLIPVDRFIPHIIYDVSLTYQLFLNDENIKLNDGDSIKDAEKFVSLINFSGKYLAMLEVQ
jgi:hypothetical protein